MSIFNVTISGNLLADPDYSTVNGSDGTPLRVAKFRIAHNVRKGKQDEKQLIPVTVTTWNIHADMVNDRLKSGSHCTVIGNIQNIGVATDKEGNEKKYKDGKTIVVVEVTATSIEFPSGSQKEHSESQSSSGRAAVREAVATGVSNTKTVEINADDTPF